MRGSRRVRVTARLRSGEGALRRFRVAALPMEPREVEQRVRIVWIELGCALELSLGFGGLAGLLKRSAETVVRRGEPRL